MATSLQKISTNLRTMDSTLKKSLMRDRKVYQALGRESSKLLKETIDKETATLEWGKGKQTDYGEVHFSTNPNASSVKLMWEGANVGFVEYGAGLHAIENPYPEPMVDYQPVRDGRVAKTGKSSNWSGKTNQAWYFKSADGTGNLGGGASAEYDVVTRGWRPVAPFYKTMLIMRAYNAKQLRYTEYQKAVAAALQKGLRSIDTM